jgi:hypothetical protein
MCATADRRGRSLFRLTAAVGLVLMTIGLAERSLASAGDPGNHAEAAGRASCDARHPDSGCSHPDHADESDIPVVDVPDGFGPSHRLCPPSPDGETAVPQKPPVRPPSF